MKSKKILFAVIILIALLLAGCAANNEMYEAGPAGFWAGLWHGLILVIAFIISLFTDSVAIYEINNTGGWYHFGYVLGIMISLSHGGIWNPVKKYVSFKCAEEKEWDEIGKKVEEKVKRGIKSWLDETEKDENDWEEIGKKVEEKIKRELKNWAEK